MRAKKHTQEQRIARLENVVTQLYLANASVNERLLALEPKTKIKPKK
jgi:hypothetical protein